MKRRSFLTGPVRMGRIAQTLALTLALTQAAACGAGAPAGSMTPGSLSRELEAARSDAKAQKLSNAAPQIVLAADEEAKLAAESEQVGDSATAVLHRERALARYARAAILAREVQAAKAEEDASLALKLADARYQELARNRDSERARTLEVEKRVAVLEKLDQPLRSGEASSPERDTARTLARGRFLEEAAQLCAAASLVGEEPKDLLTQLRASETRRDSIDGAVELRAKCMQALTINRRTIAVKNGAVSVHPDKLFSELSETKAFRLTRDERGVVVQLNEADFAKDAPSEALLKAESELRRIAESHKGFALQVVVPKSASEVRVAALKRSFGEKAQIVRSAQNAEVVFVAGASASE
jgi:hypothetical protein